MVCSGRAEKGLPSKQTGKRKREGVKEGGREGRDVPPENFLVMRIGSQLSLSDK